MENAKAQSTNAGFLTNPVIRRLTKVVSEESSSTCASYAGVVAKTIFFLILTAAGVGIYYVLQQVFASSGAEMLHVNSGEVFDFYITAKGAGLLFGAALVAIITAIISVFVQAIVPVTGTLYVLAEGYILAFISDSLKEEYRWMSFTALLLTIVLVLALLLLYCRKKIIVGHKFKTVISAVFITIIIGSLITFLLNFIPGLNELSQSVSTITANPVVSIIMSVVFVIIACLFLISDFDTVHKLVANQMPKKYEWSCAFGIAYTVLYLYLKILQLLIEIFGKNSK